MSSPFGPVIPQQGDDFLASFLQGAEMGQRQQQLEIQKKQIKLQEDQFKLEQEQNAMLGASMKNMLLSMEQQPVATPQGLQDILGLPPQLQALTPLGQIVAETPAAAIPEFAKRTEKERAQLKVDRTIEQALGAISDPEIKNEFRAFTHLNAAGIDVPKDMLANVFPTLAQHMGGLDPQVANSALRYAMTGEFSWGQIRSLLSIPSVPGISDDLKFPPMLVKGGKATELQMKSQMFLTQMQSARKTLDNLHDRGVTINIGGQLQREVRVRAGSGGIFGLAPALADMALNLGLSSEQKELVTAHMRGANAFRYAVSGQQTSDKEFVSILSYLVENVGDGPSVIAQKRAFWQAIEESLATVAAGGSREAQIDKLLRRAGTYGIPADVIRELEVMKPKAAKEDRASSGVVFSREPADPNSPATVDQIESLLQEIETKKFIMGQP